MVTFNRRILIDDDETATFERRAIERAGDPGRVLETKRIAATALMPELDDLALLPQRCRGFRARGGTTVYIVEDVPRVRTVSWLTDGDTYHDMRARLASIGAHRRFDEDGEAFRERIAHQEVFRVALPYLVWLYQFVHGSFAQALLFYRAQAVTRPVDELLVANLPNIHHDTHALCITRRVKDLAHEHLSDVEAIGVVEEEYWGSPWNNDWTHDFLTDARRIPEVASPWEWELASEDPTFVLRAPWRSAELTLTDAVDRLLNEHERVGRARPFEVFLERVRAADPYDGAPVATRDDIEVSTSTSVALVDRELHIGDTVTIPRDHFAECRSGGTFTIAWFSVPASECRFVKFVELDTPVRIIIRKRLIEGVRHVERHAPAIEAGGQRIEPGAIVVFRDPYLWPHVRCDVAQIIERARRGADGRVLVQFHNVRNDGFTVIAADGALLEGCTVLPKEDALPDGTLRALRLADGTTIEPESCLYVNLRDGNVGVRTVRYITALTAGVAGHTCATEEGDAWTVDAVATGTLSRDVAVGSRERTTDVVVGDRTVRLRDTILYDHGGGIRAHAYTAMDFTPLFGNGRQYVRVDNGTWLLLAEGGVLDRRIRFPTPVVWKADGSLTFGEHTFRVGTLLHDEQSGTLRTITKLRRNGAGAAGGPIEADLDGDDRVHLIVAHALVERFRPVWQRIACGDIVLTRGTRLRLTVPVGGYAAGKRFCVSHLLPPHGEDQATMVVLTCGLAFLLSRENARHFAWRNGTTWEPLPEDPGAYPAPPRHGIPGVGITRGARVCYVGTDHTPEERNALNQARMTVAQERHPSNNQYAIVEVSPVVMGFEPTSAFKRTQLARLGAHAIASDGFVRVFRRHSDVTCINRGAPAGTDADGKGLRIGDRVTVQEKTWNMTAGAMDVVNDRTPVPIVHTADWSGTRWLFVDCGGPVGSNRDLWGGSTVGIPHELMYDPTWWVRLTFTPAAHCVRVGNQEQDKKGAKR